MSELIDLGAFRDQRVTPVLVLLDMHEGQGEAPDVLHKCGALLASARSEGWPIAFVRLMRLSPDGNAIFPRWLKGFEPRRADMVFDRYRPSCYANTDFADTMSGAGGAFALAGFFGNIAGLSTLSDAFHHGHRVTFLFDACASQTLPGFDSAQSHRALEALAGSYGASTSAAKWIETSGRYQQWGERAALAR